MSSAELDKQDRNRYPGLGLPLRLNSEIDGRFYPIGHHVGCDGGCSIPLPVREVAMMNTIEKLTEKQEWHAKVFDDEIVAKWREEALAIPDAAFWREAADEDIACDCPLQDIMTAEIFDYCVSELRNKARYFQQTGIVPSLDALAAIAKSDSLVDATLQEDLRKAFEELIKSQGASPDWHPGSDEMVRDLVHPSMYPLVYGESRAFREEVVGTVDAVEKWASTGEVIAPPSESGDQTSTPQSASSSVFPSSVPEPFWSEKYQWLPANVSFGERHSVRFTSYINNLHPVKHADIYRTIESLVEKTIPLWDQCLAKSIGYMFKMGPGRCYTRFVNLDDLDDGNPDNWWPELPDPEEGDWEEWKENRQPLQPEPDPFQEIDYTPRFEDRLSRKFHDTGLQIIVKMASIELTPEKPNFNAGSWHVEGQMNERICATALFYLDEENIEPTSLAFRMQTSSEVVNDHYAVEQYRFTWLQDVFGTRLDMDGSPCLQNYGSVQTPQGRLLAFPNVFQHRVTPFRLKDLTKPGHRRFIALWLVDPHRRIISTANVPPQQQEWWESSLRVSQPGSKDLPRPPAEIVQLLQEKGLLPDGGEVDETLPRLPAELLNMVRQDFEAPVMSRQRALEHREKLMAERTQFHENAEMEWYSQMYNFCEH